MFILPRKIAYCPVLNRWLDLWPLLCLANEVFLLGQRLLLIVTRLLSRPINLYAFASIYLSSGYLTSSSTTHGPIPIFGPFIPTIASQNSTLPFLGKRGISIFGNHTSYTYVTFSCAGVFSTAKRHTLDASTFGTLQHLIHTASCSPHSTVWWRSYSREIFMGIWAGTLSLTFPTLI